MNIPSLSHPADSAPVPLRTLSSALFLAFFLVFFVIAPSASAQDSPPVVVIVEAEGASDQEVETKGESSPIELDDVVVTGTRSEQRRRESPVPVDVIDRESIEASGAQTLAELLGGLASVELVDSVGGTGIQMQGLPSEYVLILVDGQPVAGRVDGVVDLERYRVADVERVEVLRGAGSTLYGADALAGVIQIITRETERPLEMEAQAGYGQRNSLDLSARVGTRRKRWSARGNFSHSGSEGYDLTPDDIFTTGSAFAESSGGLSGELRLSERLKLSSQATYLRRSQERVEAGASRAVFDRVNLLENLQGRVGAHYQGDGGSSWGATVYYEQFRNQFLYDQRGSDALDQVEDSREHQLRLDLRSELPIGESHLLTIGAEGAMHRLDSPRLASEQGQRFRGAIYAQDEIFLGARDQFSLLPGARIDVDTQFGVHPSPQLAARWGVAESLNLRASVGMGYRAPSFQELLLEFENPSVGYVIVGNPALEPETSRSVQAGGVYSPFSWLEIEANLYLNLIDNLIGTVTTDSGGADEPLRFGYANIESARTRGVESAVRLRPLEGWRIDAGYTLTDSLNRQTERPLEGRSRHRVQLGLGADRLPLGIKAFTRAVLVGPRPFYRDVTIDLDEPEFSTSHILWEARLARDFGNHFTAFLRGTNLLNAGNLRFLPIAPRTVFAGVQGRY